MGPLDKEIIYRRLNRLDRILSTLEKNASVNREDYLKNEDLQAAVERRLQLATQICIDIANYLLARKRLELPDEEENLFLRLAKAEIINSAVADKDEGSGSLSEYLSA
ncbi:MAG: HepT-like ribonuclease domain-containing protein [candidate division WOR-3 bacterium]